MKTQVDGDAHARLQKLLDSTLKSSGESELPEVSIPVNFLFLLAVAKDLHELLLVADPEVDTGPLEAALTIIAINAPVRQLVTTDLAKAAVAENQYDPGKVAALLASSTIDIPIYLTTIASELTAALQEPDLQQQRAITRRVASHLYHVFENMTTQTVDDSYLKATFKSILDQLQYFATTLGEKDDDLNRERSRVAGQLDILNSTPSPRVSAPFPQAAVRLLALATSKYPDLLPDELDDKIVSELLLNLEKPEDNLFAILTLVAHLDDESLTPEFQEKVLEMLENATSEYHSNEACLMHANLASEGIARLIPADSTPQTSRQIANIALNWYKNAQNVSRSSSKPATAPKLTEVSASIQQLLHAIHPTDKAKVQHAEDGDDQTAFKLGSNELRIIGEIVAYESDAPLVKQLTTTHLPEIPELLTILTELMKSASRSEQWFDYLLRYLHKEHHLLTEKIKGTYLWVALLESKGGAYKHKIYTILSDVYDSDEQAFVYDCLDSDKLHWAEEVPFIHNLVKLKKSWWQDRQGKRLETVLDELEDPTWAEKLHAGEEAQLIQLLLPEHVGEMSDYSVDNDTNLLERMQNHFVSILTNPKVSEQIRGQISGWQMQILTPAISAEDLLLILRTNRNQIHLFTHVRSLFVGHATAGQLILAASESLIDIAMAMHAFQHMLHHTIEIEVEPKLKYVLQAYFQYCETNSHLLTVRSSESQALRRLGSDPKLLELCDRAGLSEKLNQLLKIVNSNA